MDVKPSLNGFVDGYIDDLVPVVLDLGHNAERGAQAVPLAMHTLGRPVVEEEPILRDDLLSFKKLNGEGCLEEIKTETGWTINTHGLLVILTNYKTSDWSKVIRSIINSKKTT